MSMNLHRRPMALAAAVAASMSGLGLSAEVLPGDLGHVRTPGAFGAPPKPKNRHQRLKPATGPGSINAESEMRQLVQAGRYKEAAEFYEACHRIHYKHGKPKMRWGGSWYLEYKRTAGVAA